MTEHSAHRQPDTTDKNNIKEETTRKAAHLQNGTVMKTKTSFDSKDAQSRVTFNVGGVIFQTLEVTVKDIHILKHPDFRSHFDEVKGEYFFDRDPEVFRSVLNFWRTGKLHLPLAKCGPSISHEMNLWGVSASHIEPCCWNSYSSGLDTIQSFEKLHRDAIKDKEGKYILDKPRSGCGRLRLNLWYLLTSSSQSKAAKIYECVAIAFSILSIFSFCASTTSAFQISPPSFNSSSSPAPIINTDDSRSSRVSPALVIIDYICLAFFSLEYLARLVSAPKCWKFVISLTGVVDLLAILPDYVEMIIQAVYPDGNTGNITDILLLLRLMRVIKIFRVIRHVSGLWIMIYTLRASYKDLSLMLLFLIIGTLLFGSVIYFVDDNDVFTSIPQSFWWAIVTMTTVGYGDMVPKTPWGQLVGSITTVCGVLLIGFTIPSLVNNFTSYYNLMEFDAQHRKLLSEKNANGDTSDATETTEI